MKPRAARPAHGVAWIIAIALGLSYAYFFQGGGWNPNSRLDLTRALAERGTIAIDEYRHNTGDWAFYDGHYYANKAPGLSFASAPVFLAASALARAFGVDGTRALTAPAYLTNLVVNGLPAALLGMLIFHALAAAGLRSVAVRAAAALTYGLGTLAFPYATAYYAHQPAAVLSFAAFFLLLRARQRSDARWEALLAGVAAGAAVLFETSTALAAIVLGLALLLDGRGRRLLPGFAAGGAPMAAALALYGWAAFDDPTAPWHRYANPGIEVRRDGWLFQAPSPEILGALLFLPWRGLLFTSPVLALAPFGWVRLFRADRWTAVVCAAIPLSFWVLIGSFHAWHGGDAPGPRYLVPSLPFLFIPVAFAVRRLPRLFAALASISVASMLAISLVAVEVPMQIRNPLFDFVLPYLAEGQVSVNAQGLDDYRRPPAYPKRQAPDNWSSFNLGELIWPHSALSALPLLAAWAGLGALLRRRLRACQRQLTPP